MHFHVPIFLERYGELESTQDHLRRVHRARARTHGAPGDRDLHLGRAAGRPEGLVGGVDRARVRVGARCPPLTSLARPPTPAWRAWLELARDLEHADRRCRTRSPGRRSSRRPPRRGTVALVAVAIGAVLHGRDDPQRRRSTRRSTGASGRSGRCPPARVAPARRWPRSSACSCVGAALLALRGLARRCSPGSALIGADRALRRLAQGQRALAGADGGLPRARLRRSPAWPSRTRSTRELWGAAAMLFAVRRRPHAGRQGRGRRRSRRAGRCWPCSRRPRTGPRSCRDARRSRCCSWRSSPWAGWALWLVLARRGSAPASVRLIAGIALYDALVVAARGGSAVALAVCLAAFAATIALQTKIAGT